MLYLQRRSLKISGFSLFLRKLVGNSSESHHTLASSPWFWHRHLSHSLPHNNTSPLSSSTWLSRFTYSYNFPTRHRFWSSQTAADTEHSTSDGLTVQGIVAHNWNILDENDGDWKSHAAAVAQSIQVIKRRLQVNPQFS